MRHPLQRASARRTRKLGLESLEPRYLLDAGALDPMFGVDGVVEYSSPLARESEDAVVGAFRDSADRILIAGTTVNGHGEVASVARFTSDGQLDVSYGENGSVMLPLASNYVAILDAGMTANDEILLVGRTAIGDVVAKIRPDGSLDSEFGDEGMALAFSDGNTANAVTVAPNGDIIVGGGYSEFRLSRFTSQGKRVRAFGDLGTATSSMDLVGAELHDVLALADGSVVAAVSNRTSETQVDLLVVRYDANGVWDESFGVDGATRIPVVIGDDHFPGDATLGQTSDGKIVVGTTRKTVSEESPASYDYVVARINTDGTLDATFGNAGEVELRFRGTSGTKLIDLVVEAGDSLLISGLHARYSRVDLAVARLNADGSYNADFADGGLLEERVYSPHYSTKGNLLPADDGQLYFAMTVSNDFALARIDAAGEIDESYGGDGIVTTNLLTAISDTRAYSSAVLPDSRLLVLERSEAFAETYYSARFDHVLRRYWTDGTLDTSYGDQGKFSISQRGYDLRPFGIDSHLISGNESTFVVIDTYKELVIARLDAAGEVDPAFGNDGWVTIDHTPWFLRMSRVTVWGDGELLVIGEASGSAEYVAIRLDRQGAFDESFADQGVLRIPKEPFRGGNGVKACQHDDGGFTALVGNHAGSEYYDVALQKWLAGGSLDPTFGDAGQVTAVVTSRSGGGASRHLNCLEDGGYLITGVTYAPDEQSTYPVVMARYDALGQLVDGFGDDGTVILRVGISRDTSASVEIDGAGRIIVGLTATNHNADFAVARLNPDGSMDESFGDGGTWQYDGHSFGDFLTSAMIAKNGDVIAVGYTKTGEETHLAIARIEGDRTGPSPWQNRRLPADPNGDGQITPNDPLRILNEINRNGPRLLPPYRDIRMHFDFLDANGDGYLSANDVLVIVNALNLTPTSEGEGPAAEQDAPGWPALVSLAIPAWSRGSDHDVEHPIERSRHSFLAKSSIQPVARTADFHETPRPSNPHAVDRALDEFDLLAALESPADELTDWDKSNFWRHEDRWIGAIPILRSR